MLNLKKLRIYYIKNNIFYDNIEMYLVTISDYLYILLKKLLFKNEVLNELSVNKSIDINWKELYYLIEYLVKQKIIDNLKCAHYAVDQDFNFFHKN